MADVIQVGPGETPFLNKATGQIEVIPTAQAAEAARDIAARGLVPATTEDIARREQYLKNTETAEQAKSAGKLFANTATFGLSSFDSAEDKQKLKDFQDASPTAAALTQVAGAAAPALLGGAGAGAVMARMGASAGAIAIGTTVAEEVLGNTAYELEAAKQEEREISLPNILIGIGVGSGLSMAGRYAAGAISRTATRFKGAGTDASDVLDGAPASPLARGRKLSAERRNLGAAGSKDPSDVPLTERDIRTLAPDRDNIHAQADALGINAIDSAIGGENPTFDAVHNIGLKPEDVAGKMGDADNARMAAFTAERVERLQEVADRLGDGLGQKAAARELLEQIAIIEGAETTEDLALGFDHAKRILQRQRTRYGRLQDSTAVEIATTVEEASEDLLKGLQDPKIWGKHWAELQEHSNARWSGDDGIIKSGNRWQSVFAEKDPGGETWRRGRTVPSFRASSEGFVKKGLALEPHAYAKVKKDALNWADKVEEMTLNKTELGAGSVEHTPVLRLRQDVEDIRQAFHELDVARKLEHGGKHIFAKEASRGAAASQAENMFEAASSIPIVGGTLKTGRKAYETVTGKAMFEPPVAPPLRTFTREEARAASKARQGALGKPVSRGGTGAPPAANRPPTGDLERALGIKPKPQPSAEAGSASVGAMGAAGAAGLAGLAGYKLTQDHPVTDALAEISENSRAIQERAALGLVAKDSRAPKLPPLTTRFRGNAPNLQAAFQIKLADLERLQEDPEAFINGFADAFGDIADGGHPALFEGLVQRAQVGAQYLMANAPPSIAIGMTRPDGIAPDAVAVMKWASMYEAVFSPGDVIYDVGTGDATPTQIRALREVHPDIYAELQSEILNQVGQSTKLPFETLRSLDVLFNLPGVAGLAFSGGMQKTMADAYAKKQPAGGSSLSGESGIAPTSATSKLAGLAAIQ